MSGGSCASSVKPNAKADAAKTAASAATTAVVRRTRIRPTPRRRVAALTRLLRQESDLVFANAPPPFREPLVSLGQPPVTVVEPRRPVVELPLAPFDTPHLRGRTFGLLCRLGLARLDLRDRLRQPNATFL